jgi:hypothetical protein
VYSANQLKEKTMELDDLIAALKEEKKPEDKTNKDGQLTPEQIAAKKAEDDKAAAAVAAKAKDDADKAAAAAAANQSNKDAIAGISSALDGVQYQNLLNSQIDNYFAQHPEMRGTDIRNAVTTEAFNAIKQSISSGKPMDISTALDQAATSTKERLVGILKSAAPILREIQINKTPGKSDFWKNAEKFTNADFYRVYSEEILPGMTVQGLDTVKLMKGFDGSTHQEREEIYPGKAGHYNPKIKET